MLEHVDRSQPSPEEKVIVLEELNRLLSGLSEELRQIVLWKLDGFTNAEIACTIGRTVRCVELKMQLIRKRLELKVDQLGALVAAGAATSVICDQVPVDERPRRSSISPRIKMPAATATLSEPAPLRIGIVIRS